MICDVQGKRLTSQPCCAASRPRCRQPGAAGHIACSSHAPQHTWQHSAAQSTQRRQLLALMAVAPCMLALRANAVRICHVPRGMSYIGCGCHACRGVRALHIHSVSHKLSSMLSI